MIDHPKYTSVIQIKADDKKEARKKANLEEEFVDVKNTVGIDPTLRYIEKPKINSKTLLELQRKAEALAQLKQFENNMGVHKDVKSRIDDRENCNLRLGYKEHPGKTRGVIVNERKQVVIENLTRKYGNVTIGIHGQELPKFSNTATAATADSKTREWWKYRTTFVAKPAFQSAVELKENIKFWAKNDDIKISDVREEQAPMDHFKSTHEKQQFKDQVTDKIC